MAYEMGTTLLVLEAAAAVIIANVIITVLTSPINNIPGPILAKFTNLWRFFNVWRGKAEVTQLKLHRRYGPAVRLGPNCVSLSDPDLIKTIYSTKEKWVKSRFYSINDVAIGKGQVISTTFSTRDEQWHTTMTKSIARLYSMTSILRYEPLVDDTIQLFLNKLNEGFASQQKLCPIDRWLHFFAWDVIGHVTFSKELGFLASGSDIDSLIHTGERAVDYFAVIGQLPFLDKFLDKNPVHRVGPPSFGSAAAYGAQRLFARMAGDDGHDAAEQTDMLDSFVELKKTDPDVDDNRIIAYLMNNVAAGSDTTAIELRAVVYYLCKNRVCMKQLQAELDTAGISASYQPAQWKDVSKLSYFDAVIRESIRLHPAVQLPLERVVPSSGLQLKDGRMIPGGTIVGINPAVVHHDESVFGADVDSFKPDRWLKKDGENPEAFEQRYAKMKETDLAFGHGKRMCSGRHVAYLETYKVIASLFAKFDVKLVEPEKEWALKNSWFNRQWDMDCWIEPRRSTA